MSNEKAEVHQLPVRQESERPPPRRIMRPCDWGLINATNSMETQVGTVEAYNRLCDAAASLKAKIDRGDGKQAHAMWATDPKFIYPKG